MVSQLHLEFVNFNDAQAPIVAIRQQVFQIEQQVDPALDFDGLDAACQQLLAHWAGVPVGTARLRRLDWQTIKIERVAVLRDYRGYGIGKAIVQAAVNEGAKAVPIVKLNAQLQVKEFYERLGFAQQGQPFEEAGIPHVSMRYAVIKNTRS